MANTREIQSRMKSIQDTMKITGAMYTISSSKLKKARKSLADTEPYFYSLQQMISRILRHLPELENPYFDTRPQIPPEERKIGYIVISADKGLAGAYNHNVFKLVEEQLKQPGKPVLFVVGVLGRQYFAKKGIDVEEQFHYTVQNPNMSRARIISETMLDYYLNGRLDEIHLIYTQMVNPMKMEAQMEQLLPLKRMSFSVPPSIPLDVPMEEITLKPSADAVINNIVPNYLSGFIYGALVESYSCEQNSRMMAMQTATDSARKMLSELSIAYNRARQAAITQEITEVISGAKAQKNKK